MSQFVGRTRYLREIDDFIKAPVSDLKGQVLLLVGPEGIGKTALLKKLAVDASNNGHVVAIGDIEKENPNFYEQIYPVIAQIKAEEKFKFGASGDWLRTGGSLMAMAADVFVTGGAAVAISGVINLGGILSDIRSKHHQENQADPVFADIFHEEIMRRQQKLAEDERIVILINPEKDSPPAVISLLRYLSNRGMPDKLRIIIAQRPDDKVIDAHKRRELNGVGIQHVPLGFLEDEEETEFIASMDSDNRLGKEVRNAIKKKYSAWPLLLELAMGELLRKEEEIRPEDVEYLPADINGLWLERYERITDPDCLKVLYTVCILPHPYPRERLASFAGISHEAVTAALNNPAVKEMLVETAYEETLTGGTWPHCPSPRHATAREFVREEIGKNPEHQKELADAIISDYLNRIGTDLDRADIDRDALVFLPQILFYKGDEKAFIEEVLRLQEIKGRYGLLDSLLNECEIIITTSESPGLEKYRAAAYGNKGNAHQILGELDTALEMYQKSLEMYEKSLEINKELGSRKGMATQYGNMGIVYLILDQLETALDMFNKSLEIGDKYDFNKVIASQYGNIGIIYGMRKDFDSALKMFNNSFEISKESNYQEGMATAYLNTGKVYQARGELMRALDRYEEALKIDEGRGSNYGMAFDYINMSNVYKELGDMKSACKYWRESLKLFKEIGVRDMISRVESWLKESCKETH